MSGEQEPDNKRKQPSAGEGRMSRKKRLLKSQPCYRFMESGTCEYGDECRFAHGECVDLGDDSASAQRKLLRDQTAGRMQGGGEDDDGVVAIGAKVGNVVERYYTQLFYADDDGNDQFANMHSNRLCVIGVAPHHPLVRDQLRVAKVDFNINGKNLMDNRVKGKKKKGGMWLDAHTPICTVHTEDGREFIMRSCVRSSLMEVNDLLIDNPQLIVDKPLLDGHIAIVRPKILEVAEVQRSMLSLAEYTQLRSLSEQSSTGSSNK